MTLLSLLIAMNLAAFLLFAVDKARAARRAWRISERTLMTVALVGGSAGALAAQQLLRHKTRKELFRTGLPLVLAAHIGIAVAFLLPAP